MKIYFIYNMMNILHIQCTLYRYIWHMVRSRAQSAHFAPSKEIGPLSLICTPILVRELVKLHVKIFAQRAIVQSVQVCILLTF